MGHLTIVSDLSELHDNASFLSFIYDLGEYFTIYIYFLMFFLTSKSFYYQIFWSAKKWSINLFFLLQRPDAIIGEIVLKLFCLLCNFAYILDTYRGWELWSLPRTVDLSTLVLWMFSLIFFCQRSGFMRVSANLGLKRGLSMISQMFSKCFWAVISGKLLKYYFPHRVLMQVKEIGERITNTRHILALQNKFQCQWFNGNCNVHAASLESDSLLCPLLPVCQ